MKRTICISALNEGKAFEVPERQIGDRIKMYKAMATEPKELLDDAAYNNTMTGAYLVLYVLQRKFPKLIIDDILGLTDEKFMELNFIILDIHEKKLPSDFQKPLPKKKKGKN